MGNIFEEASKFYTENPIQREIEPNYRTTYQEVLFMIDSAPFLSLNEKDRLKKLLPFLNLAMLESFKLNLLREGLAYHKTFPAQKKVLRWLKLIIKPTKLYN